MQSQKKKEDAQNVELKDFLEIEGQVFDFFEELTGKRVNREFAKKHVRFYLDEGFEFEDFRLFFLDQIKSPYFLEHPTYFTIARLLPMEDEKRVQTTWDCLAHFFAMRSSTKTSEKLSGLEIVLRDCGHRVKLKEWRESGLCETCTEVESAYEIMQSPVSIFPRLKTNEARELAWHFMKKEDETPLQYAERTYEKRKEIRISRGETVGSLDSYLKIFKTLV